MKKPPMPRSRGSCGRIGMFARTKEQYERFTSSRASMTRMTARGIDEAVRKSFLVARRPFLNSLGSDPFSDLDHRKNVALERG
jgi:hypothetical protein